MKDIQLRQDLAELLMMPLDEIEDELKLDSLGQWDSFTVVSLMGAISQHYQLVLSAEALMQCITVGCIFQLLNQKTQEA